MLDKDIKKCYKKYKIFSLMFLPGRVSGEKSMRKMATTAESGVPSERTLT